MEIGKIEVYCDLNLRKALKRFFNVLSDAHQDGESVHIEFSSGEQMSFNPRALTLHYSTLSTRAYAIGVAFKDVDPKE